MRVNNYLSVCMFQLNIPFTYNSQNEYLIETREVLHQIEAAFGMIEKYKPNITIFPWGSYAKCYEEIYKNLSISRIIVAGSYYKNDINTTVIFLNGKKLEISHKNFYRRNL